MNSFKYFFASVAGCVFALHPSALAQEETPAGLPFDPYPAQVTATKVMHFDNSCWKIATAGGTWYFENGETEGKSGFNSAFDPYGNDWIGNDAGNGDNESPSSGGKHEYRGWPNFGEGNFDHPQRKSGATTKWVDEAGTEIPFTDKLEGDHLIMRSFNEDYEIEYHFFMSHAAIKVLKAAKKYSFLFEGPIGGEGDDSSVDNYVVSDGKVRKVAKVGCCGHIDDEFDNLFPRPYFYLFDEDPKDSVAFYAGVKGEGPPTAGDEGWRQGDNMVIFSFGRDDNKRAYEGTDAVCVFGFYPKEPHVEIDAFIKARLETPFEPYVEAVVTRPMLRNNTLDSHRNSHPTLIITPRGLELLGPGGIQYDLRGSRLVL